MPADATATLTVRPVHYFAEIRGIHALRRLTDRDGWTSPAGSEGPGSRQPSSVERPYCASRGRLVISLGERADCALDVGEALLDCIEAPAVVVTSRRTGTRLHDLACEITVFALERHAIANP
jgi:hypothetical protein